MLFYLIEEFEMVKIHVKEREIEVNEKFLTSRINNYTSSGDKIFDENDYEFTEEARVDDLQFTNALSSVEGKDFKSYELNANSLLSRLKKYISFQATYEMSIPIYGTTEDHADACKGDVIKTYDLGEVIRNTAQELLTLYEKTAKDL
jgi:hypothetical protein